MTLLATLRKTLILSPIPAATLYGGGLFLLLFICVSSIQDVVDAHADVTASAAMLEQLDGRRPTGREQVSGADAPSGSPFLEGSTVTVAGAALLQRVAGAVTKLGGNMLSSQVELQGNQAKAGFLSMIASCEIEQRNLQPLIYDLEAGMPFLFVDQLAVQAPATASASGEGKLRVLLTVSGQWQGKDR
jgi:general secretion pathway protein M